MECLRRRNPDVKLCERAGLPADRQISGGRAQNRFDRPGSERKRILEVRRFSNNSESLRCPACKSHVTAADTVCPVCGEALPPASQNRPQKGASGQNVAKPGKETEANRPLVAKSGASAAPTRSGTASSGEPNSAGFTSTELAALVSASKLPASASTTAKANLPQPATEATPSRVAPSKTSTPKPPTQPTPRLSQPAKSVSPVESETKGWLKQAIQAPPTNVVATAPTVSKPSRPLSVRYILVGLIALCGLVLGGLLVRAGLQNNQGQTTAAPTPVAAATVKIAIVFAGPTTQSTPSTTPIPPTVTASVESTESVEGVAVLPPITESLTNTAMISSTGPATPSAVAVISETATATSPPATLTPTPTSTHTPTETPTETPTQAPSATATASPTSTSLPTATPQPTYTATRAPTATELPTSTSLPTATTTSLPTSTTLPTPTKAPTTTPANTPVPANAPISYVVRDGDSCLQIARRFGITVARLVAYNQLDANTCFLHSGATVLIPPGEARPTATPVPTKTPAPTATPVAGTPYTVQPGDSCLEIAQRFKTTVADLATANQLDRTTCFINAGRTLIIPNLTVVVAASPTATAAKVVAAPVLIAPANGATVPANLAEVQLEWRFDGPLAFDEYFVVQIQPSGASRTLIFQTKSKTMNVPRDAGPAAGQNVIWQVQVRRVVTGDSGSALTYEDSGPPSETRSFRWP